MKHSTFIKEATESILTDIAVNSNQLMGQSKTNFLSTGLFLQLPIEIEAIQSDHMERQKHLQLDQLVDLFSSNLSTDRTKVIFTFLYADEKHLKHILRVIKYNLLIFTFHYIKQIQHVVRKHGTQVQEATMFKLVKTKENPFYLIDLANNYAVNYSVKELIDTTPSLKVQWKGFDAMIPTYDPTITTEAQILHSLADKASTCTVAEVTGNLVKVETTDLTYITEEKLPATSRSYGTSQSADTVDLATAALADRLTSSISSSTKGTAVGEVFKQLFDAVEVNVKWFEDFKRSFNNIVHYKTDTSHSSWASLSNTYRHIYTAPTEINEDPKVKLIISIDSSGSMHTEDLQKLLYMIKDKSKNILECRVLIHTSAVIQSFIIKHDYDLQLNPEFKTAFSVRHASGGTSHKDVFQHIQDMEIVNPEEYVYMSLSDNYSDIETFVPKFPIMKKLSTYWLTPSDGRQLNTGIVGGTTITLP